MKQLNLTKEEIGFIIDRLKEVCANPGMIKEKFLSAECMFWGNNNNSCNTELSCVECTEVKLKAFLDIVKNVFVNGVPLIQVTSQEPKEKELHKCRLYSAYGETLDWIEITDEQLRLMEYLQDNDLLGDEVEFEECEAPNFKKI